MGKLFSLLFIAACVVAVIAGLTYFRMGTYADQFTTRIGQEVLAPYDIRFGPEGLRKKIMGIAREEHVPIADDDLVIDQNNGSGATTRVDITMRFTLAKLMVKRRFVKSLTRTFSGGSMASPGLPAGFSSGSAPSSSSSRDINAHRNSIHRAVSGQMP